MPSGAYAYASEPAEPPTFHAPPAPASPVASTPKKKSGKCLLYGCGCLVILALLVAIVIVALFLFIPDRIQSIFDQAGVPIQLTDTMLRTGWPLA